MTTDGISSGQVNILRALLTKISDFDLNKDDKITSNELSNFVKSSDVEEKLQQNGISSDIAMNEFKELLDDDYIKDEDLDEGYKAQEELISSLSEKIEEAKPKLDELSDKINELEEKIEQENETLKEAEEAEQKAEENLAEKKKEAEEAQKEYDDKKEEVEKKTAQLKKARSFRVKQILQKTLTRLQGELDELKGKLDTANAEFSAATEAFDAAKAERERVEGTVQDLETQKEEKTKERDGIEKEMFDNQDKLEKELGYLQGMSAANTEKSSGKEDTDVGTTEPLAPKVGDGEFEETDEETETLG